ncbi:MAG TPA: hypothetical protein VFQ04_13090 [Actinomycetes bacterium]|nr:hypothetical protein [Actinomycetes bacterium]
MTLKLHREAPDPQVTAISRTTPWAPTVTAAWRGASGLAASSWAT